MSKMKRTIFALLEFYRKQGLLAGISGLGSVESVSQRVLEALGSELIGK